MTDVSLPKCNNVYKEDISTLAAGTEIIGSPCVVWDILVGIEADSTAIVNFSNTADSYNSTYRVLKVVVDGPGTEQVGFGTGLYCSTGLCATSNVAGVDIMANYD